MPGTSRRYKEESLLLIEKEMSARTAALDQVCLTLCCCSLLAEAAAEDRREFAVAFRKLSYRL